MINYHKLFNTIANEQLIEPGSLEWRAGGLEAWASSTGDHAAYGWRHTHKLSQEWVKAVIANYAHRRVYYENQPKRLIGYGIAGRPVGWLPEDAQDMTDGQVGYLTSKGVVLVSGPDVLHFHIGPLLEVYDTALTIPYNIKALGSQYGAHIIAGALVRYLMADLAGMVRNGPITYLFGERGASNIVKAITGAAKRNLIAVTDQAAFATWLEKTMLPFYEKAPGHEWNVKGYHGFQVYNGLYWTLPAFYDLMNVLPDGEHKTRLTAIVKRQSQWVKELQSLKADLNIEKVDIVDDTMLSLPAAPSSLLPYVKLNSATGTGTDWSLWAYRAARVAAKVLNDPSLDEAMKPVYAKHIAITKYDNKRWLVDADGNYAEASVQ